jgi:hypothetical protein
MTRFPNSLVLIVFICFSVFVSLPHANGQYFDTGDKDLNITVGIGSPWVLYNDYRTILPPIVTSFDYGFRDDIGPGVISVGGLLAFTTYKDPRAGTDGPDEYGYKSTTVILAARSTYHYQFFEKFDTYAGMHMGLRIEDWKEYGDFPPINDKENSELHFLFNVYGGAKYYFTDKLAAMLEMGFSIAFINAGICIRL